MTLEQLTRPCYDNRVENVLVAQIKDFLGEHDEFTLNKFWHTINSYTLLKVGLDRLTLILSFYNFLIDESTFLPLLLTQRVMNLTDQWNLCTRASVNKLIHSSFILQFIDKPCNDYEQITPLRDFNDTFSIYCNFNYTRSQRCLRAYLENDTFIYYLYK